MKKPARPDPRNGHDPVADAELPAVVPTEASEQADPTARSREIETALAQVQESNLGDRMKRILGRVAAGENTRKACDAESSSSYSDAYKAARRFKLISLKTSKLIDGQRSVAGLATELLEERLLEQPDKFSGPQLAIVAGISVDKVLASDKAATDDGSVWLSAFEKTAARIISSGTGVKLEVTVSPAAVAAGHVNADASDAIDVTPRGSQ